MLERTRDAANQVAPLVGYNVASSDAALTEALNRMAGSNAAAALEPLGQLAGSAEAQDHGKLANTNPPRLLTHDRAGNRIDEVRFHPSWHWLLGTAVGHGLAAAPWEKASEHAHLMRAAGFYVWSQVESGHGCPVSMTYAAVPALRADPELAAEWTPRLAARTYDAALKPPARKAGCLAGMGMTEKQGGSDVRTNSTTATPLAGEGEYVLDGHKWFTSAPMNDVFLILAQAPAGLTCFVVPRVLADGSRNSFTIVRLKDKPGNRSNASAEIELNRTWGRRLGDEGRGIATIIEMVAATRLDCVLGSAALMRRATAEASWHAAHRRAFGGLLADKPLMRNVLADLAIEAEAALVLGLRLAEAVDRPDDEHERGLRRLGLPLAKFWVCKRTPAHVAEAMECLGGNGYVEDSVLPLLFRESPLNSIWEGSANVNALDVLRAVQQSPWALDAWLHEVGAVCGDNRHLDAAVHDVLTRLADLRDAEGAARILAARMSCCLQAALLLRGNSDVADLFCVSRLGGEWAGTFGTLPSSGSAIAEICARTAPRLVQPIR